jgi:hypothetical protein
VAYVIGFFVLLAILGWHPNAPHKARVSAWINASVYA